jgi:hypothetical protein
VEPFLINENFISLIVGPVGSTKTTAGIMKIAFHAQRMAPCTDGIRRSRAIWIRNTREQLRDTSIPDFLAWFPDGVAGVYSKTDYKFLLKFGDVEAEVMFRGLDDANDVRRLLSLQASFAIMDEFREIHKDIFEAVQGRLGRYPNGKMVPHRPEWGVDEKGLPNRGCVTDTGKPNKHIWGMSNPPDMETFWETYLSDPPSTAEVFFQPSGLSQEADWLKFLPSQYYEDLMNGKSQDWVDVYINAKFGKSLSGHPVFRSFNTENHVAKTTNIIPGPTVVVGVDAGLSPAAVIAQVDYTGRVIIHHAIIADGMGALRFIREKLKPLLVNKFAGHTICIVIDPAAFQRAQTDERTVADIFQAEGFALRPAATNAITARLAAVEKYLTRNIDGKYGLLISQEGAPALVSAMRGRYRYKINTKGDADDKPEKNHPHSDVADALQYVCLHADGGTLFGAKAVTKREVKRVSAVGWT